MTIEKEKFYCSCNECANSTYLDTPTKNRVDTIYRVHIGGFGIALCKDCLEQLIGAAVVALNNK